MYFCYLISFNRKDCFYFIGRESNIEFIMDLIVYIFSEVRNIYYYKGEGY